MALASVVRKPSGIKVFISHSTDDAEWAKEVVERLDTGIGIKKKQILCTSLAETKLRPGGSVADELRHNLEDCSVVIGLLTPGSVDSDYLLMELGAAWGLRKTCCLLLRDVEPERVPGPFKSIVVVGWDDPDAMSRLLKTVKDSIECYETRPRGRLKTAWAFGLLAAMAAGGASFADRHFSDASYRVHLLTGTPGGLFEKLGNWVNETMTAQGDAAPVVETTHGSVDNCKRIEGPDGNTVALAWTSQQCGATSTHQSRKARVVAALYPEVLQFLVQKSVDIPGELPDLRGKKVYLGNALSGTRESAEKLLSQAGYEEDEVKKLIEDNQCLSEKKFDEAGILLQSGDIDAAFFGTGLNASAVTTALEKGTVRLVSLPPDLIDRIITSEKGKSESTLHERFASLENDPLRKQANFRNPYGLTAAGYRPKDGNRENSSSIRSPRTRYSWLLNLSIRNSSNGFWILYMTPTTTSRSSKWVSPQHIWTIDRSSMRG